VTYEKTDQTAYANVVTDPQNEDDVNQSCTVFDCWQLSVLVCWYFPRWKLAGSFPGVYCDGWMALSQSHHRYIAQRYSVSIYCC